MFNKVNLEKEWKVVEEEVLKFWQDKQIFKASIQNRQNQQKFVFFEGPPTANGKPGIHHVLARIYKDMVCRYKTMQGFLVERKAGWDTHGLPVELEVEKRLKISGKNEIEKFGIAEFIEECKKSIFTYKEDWDQLTTRIGYWLDLDNPYITCSNEYIESVWWALHQIYEKGLMVKGHKVVPHCPRCQTTLSSHEVAQGYKDNTPDPSIFVLFPLIDRGNVNLLVWTTTPWTLTANVAAAIKSDAIYAEIVVDHISYILAKDRISFVFPKEEIHIVSEFKGKELLGLRYQAPFDFYHLGTSAHFVIEAPFVGLEEGTGIVHIAPAFGVDDMDVSLSRKLPVVISVLIDGKLKEEITPFQGLFVKDADPLIIKDLKERRLLLKSETIKHTYPFCWRCSSPLLYMAKDSWFIKVSEIRDQLMVNNEQINWLPGHIKKGRFGEWIKDAKDWAISRERYWGTPLNIWTCSSCEHTLSIGSIAELQEKSGQTLEKIELHRPYIDAIKIKCPKCSGEMNRVPDVIDCWLDSGSMPFAQNHYPFEKKEIFNQQFPADFISEGIDQTRGWFYTMLVLSTLLFGVSPYKACLTFELVLDEKGEKMSKSRGNVVKVDEVIEAFGVDPIRWSMFFASTPYVPRRFSQTIVNDALRNFLLPLLNVASFFTTYANIDHWSPTTEEIKQKPASTIDAWILSRLNQLILQVNESMDAFDVTDSAKKIATFVEELTNWYIRRSRRRFWKSENDTDKESAYQTLYQVLFTLSSLLAPMVPFLAEYLYQTLISGSPKSYRESVHLLDYPQSNPSLICQNLVDNMELTREIVSAGLRARKKSGIKARYPLSKIIILPKGSIKLNDEFKGLILDELNVKAVQETEKFTHYGKMIVKPNLPVIGKKISSKLPAIKEVLTHWEPSEEQVQEILKNQSFDICIGQEMVTLAPEDIFYQFEGKGLYLVEDAGKCIVILDTARTAELIEEGQVRELIHKIQNVRKEQDFKVEDKIIFEYKGGTQTRNMIEKYKDFLMIEVLASSTIFNETMEGGCTETIESTGETITFKISQD
jgi:isoleucyl-tRNA synthetase